MNSLKSMISLTILTLSLIFAGTTFAQGWTAGSQGDLYHTGKVGIGTTQPSAQLTVDYKLMPLEELEKQIQAQKHLPGIPSEAEVLKNGVSLDEMQEKLLAKVEELTLYLIQQNKKLEQLSKENEALKKKFPY